MHRFIIFLFLLPTISIAQSTIYYGSDFFTLGGTDIPDSLKENRYDRLPLAYKDLVRGPVWDLSKASAGLHISFSSNSTSIHVQWDLLNNNTMNHMAETGIKGIDLYYRSKGTWQYLNTARPKGLENEVRLISNMKAEMREYRMFLPLYDGVRNIEVGVDSSSAIRKAPKNNLKPIIFYGTSITQGGCASRPGMAHTNIISRKLGVDVINFGFSGNGRMEQPICELIAQSDPLFYVVECLPNMTPEQVTERTIALVNTVRKKRPSTPIVLVENFIYEPSVLDRKMDKKIDKLNSALEKEYQKMMEDGYENIHYISSKGATGQDHEGTVDGVHFTDLGFIRYADFLIEKFTRLGLVTEKLKKS